MTVETLPSLLSARRLVGGRPVVLKRMSGSSKNLAFGKIKSRLKKQRQNSLVLCRPREAESGAAFRRKVRLPF